MNDNRAKFNGLLVNVIVAASIFQMFFVCFPRSYLEAVIIEHTNESLYVTFIIGDIIRWIDIQFFWKPWQEIVEGTFGH